MQSDQASQKERAKAVIVASIRAAGGKFKNRTNLFKVFYLSHLIHMARHGRSLTSWKIQKLQRGPVPRKGDSLLDALEQDGVIVQPTVPRGPYFARDANIVDDSKALQVEQELTPIEVESVVDAVDYLQRKNATEVSEWSHDFSRAWRKAEIGEALDIYVDLIMDEAEYDGIRERLGKASSTVESVFGRA